MSERWVSVDDVADHLGVGKVSIYRWIENRGLPATKIGKLWKFRLSEVDAWMIQTTVKEEFSPPLRKDAARRTVLVIDDDPLVRESLADFLDDNGYDALLASNGAEALALLESSSPQPSLIILDLGMPKLNGWQFREKQSSNPRIASIPVIVVTAVASANVTGATVLRKPLRLGALTKAMQTLLEAQ
jgi:excisionase family DNA binding protein